jgi:Bacteriophage Sf6, terminase small subunit-like
MSDEKVMWAEDYERLKAQERLLKEQERMNQQRIAAEAEKLIPLKNKIDYSDRLAQEICERISAGELLINICDEPHMPTVRRVNAWLRDNLDFKSLYDSSISDRLSIFEEEVIKIADDCANDFKEVIVRGQKKKVADPDVIARAKLRVEVRFKHLKAGKPQKWGESTTLKVRNDGDEFDPASMSAEELEKKIADLEKKNSIIKSV